MTAPIVAAHTGSNDHEALDLSAGPRGDRFGGGALDGAGLRAGPVAPPGAVQVVTDHRMALSLSADRTILWDQFRYSGRPSDFSWILPIRNGPDVRIEVADNRFLTALDNLSAPVLNAPQRPYCDAEADSSFLSGARAARRPPRRRRTPAWRCSRSRWSART